MPDVSYSDPKSKSNTVFDMDQIRLKKGETARVAIMDPTAKMQICHYVRADEGEETRGRYYVCLGDYTTVMQNQSDSERCPICRIAEPGRDVMVSMPRRRFVLHVARYSTNSQGSIIKPISLTLQAWVFGDDKFNKLIDRAQEFGDLRKRDIALTCTSQNYQQYDMVVSDRMLIATDPALVAQYKELQGLRNKDIERLLGQVLNFEQLERIMLRSSSQTSEPDGQAESAAIREVMADLDLDTPKVVQLASEPLLLASEPTTPSSTFNADVLDLDKLLG